MSTNVENKEAVQNATESQQIQKQNDKEYNFAQIRKQLEQERAERLAWQKRAEEAEKSRQEPSRSALESNYEDEPSDEPYVDEKRLQRKFNRFEANFRKEVERTAEEKARALLEAERQNAFLRSNADFHEILKEEHLQKFAEKYPEIAEPMLEMPNTFARQKLLYQNIKALGIHKPPEPPKPSIQDKIDANRRSPHYHPSGIANAPYATAGDFSDLGKENAYKKMKELQKNMRL